MTQKSYYITTPIYYVNDKPHIGHAYTTLACDVLARFKRLDGYQVKFLTGTDEHGQKVETSAQKAGMDPQSFTDKVSQSFFDLAKALNFSNDDFIRTTQERHKKAVSHLWERLVETGDIYLGAYEGWYAMRDEAFYTETEITTDEDGVKRAPTGAEVEWVKEPSYFFRLSKWQDKLLELYNSGTEFVLPNSRLNEVKRFVEGGLQDLSISRTSFSWGVPVPNDPDHVMYVWLDALTNYLTAVGYPDTDHAEYQAFWPADVHMVGKDILRFHAVYWPAFLMAADLPLPKRVFAHGWWTNEGEKISKSLGNVIDPYHLINTYGLDQTRFFLLREVPFGNDGDFSEEAIISRTNSDLANDLGNLAQRSLSMVFKNCQGAFPTPGEFNEADQALFAMVEAVLPEVREQLDRQAFHKALEAIWRVVGEGNRYVDEQAPWTLKKTDPDRMGTVLYVLSDVLRQLALLVQPFCPEAADKLLTQLGVEADKRDFAFFGSDYRLPAGRPLEKPTPVFPRYVKEESQEG